MEGYLIILLNVLRVVGLGYGRAVRSSKDTQPDVSDPETSEVVMGTRLNSVLNMGESESTTGDPDIDRADRSGNLQQDYNLRQPDIARLVSVIGPTTINVLVSGGVKSEQQKIAKSIHNLSNRRRGAFISVDCAELPPDPFASELFGVGEGARPHAASQTNCFNRAYKGTLFLNNIDAMSLSLQRKVLRVLKNRETFGQSLERHKRIDVRIVAACRRRLSELVEQEVFDEELYHLLNIFPIVVS